MQDILKGGVYRSVLRNLRKRPFDTVEQYSETTPMSSIDQKEVCDCGFYGLPKPHFGFCARATRPRVVALVLDTHCYYYTHTIQ